MSPAEGGSGQVGTTKGNVKRSLRSGAFRAVLSAPLSLLTGPFIVHHVGLTSFGTWSTLLTLLFIGALVDAGVTTEIVRRVADAQARGDQALMQRSVSEGTSLLAAAGLGVAILGVVFSPVIVRVALPGLSRAQQHQARIVLVLVVVLLLVQLVSTAYFAVLTGLQRQDIVNRAGVISSVLSIAVTVVLAAAGWQLWALAVGYSCGVVLTVALQLHGLRRVLPQWRAPLVRVRRQMAGAFLRTSIYLSVGGVAELVDTQLDKILLARYVGVGSTAQYQIGASLALQVRTLAIMPLILLLPGIAERRVSGLHRQFYNRVSTPLTAAAVAAMMGIVCIGYPFTVLLYGGRYGQVGEATRAFGACGMFAVLATPWTFYAVANGQARLTAFSAGVAVVVNASVSSTLIVLFGFNGSLIGSFAAAVAGAAALGVALKRVDPAFPIVNRRLSTALVSMALVAGASWWILGDHHLSLLGLTVAAIASGAALAACLVLTGAVTMKDAQLLLRREIPVAPDPAGG